MYEVSKNISFPPNISGPVSKYPWAQMEVGDSFPLEKPEVLQVRSGAQYRKVKHGEKYRVRKYNGEPILNCFLGVVVVSRRTSL